MAIPEMISLEDARELVLSHVSTLETEEVSILEMIGRVAAEDLTSDIDIAPFAHSAMDGFAMRAAQLEGASPESPVELDVVAEVPAGAHYDGELADNQCVRIMTGAPLPDAADCMVKYEIVDIVSGDGRVGSRVAFTAPSKPGDQIRQAGEEAKAKQYADQLNQTDAVVTDVQKAKQTKRPPKLFSLTDLQSAANRRYGFNPKKTLQAAQTLYEKGIITYPRTNTNYMAEGDRGMIAGVLKGYGPAFEMKRVFDDSKVDGHSAITPTGKEEKLTGDTAKVFDLIKRRFQAVFCKEPCTVLKTTVTIDCIEQFKVSGEVPITQGWKKYETVSEKTVELPEMNVGDLVEHDFKPVASETKPPAHHTVTSLGKWMQNPFRKSEEEEVDYAKMISGMEIGTEATRARIIDKAIGKDYIDLTKNTYTIRPAGRFLVESCRALGIDMSSKRTAEMGRDAKAVSRGEKTMEDVLGEVRTEIREIIGDGPMPPQPSGYTCPVCGKQLNGNVFKLECECGFSFRKVVAGKFLEEDVIRMLLAGNKTPLLHGFKSKAGRPFSAYLIPQQDGNVTFDFPPREPKPEKVSLGNCPKCGKPVYENKKGFGCSGWKPGNKGCDFVIWKYDRRAKRKIDAEQARRILAGETIEVNGQMVSLEDYR